MQRLTRERLPRFQFGHTQKKIRKIRKSKKIRKKEIKKNRKEKSKKSKKKKIQKIKKKENPKKKEFAFSSPGQNMRLLSLPYS